METLSRSVRGSQNHGLVRRLSDLTQLCGRYLSDRIFFRKDWDRLALAQWLSQGGVTLEFTTSERSERVERDASCSAGADHECGRRIPHPRGVSISSAVA